jgi:hypothetical protein
MSNRIVHKTQLMNILPSTILKKSLEIRQHWQLNCSKPLIDSRPHQRPEKTEQTENGHDLQQIQAPWA